MHNSCSFPSWRAALSFVLYQCTLVLYWLKGIPRHSLCLVLTQKFPAREKPLNCSGITPQLLKWPLLGESQLASCITKLYKCVKKENVQIYIPIHNILQLFRCICSFIYLYLHENKGHNCATSQNESDSRIPNCVQS